MRNLAVGYFSNEPFIEACEPYLPRIREVYFGWPGVLTCRSTGDDDTQPNLIDDLRWCREHGVLLDALFNCNCYGERAIGREMADEAAGVLSDMKRQGLYPDIVTTTSPFIAHVLKLSDSALKVRASVNMRIHGSIGFEACEALFDEFYVSRENQRDFGYMARMRDWAALHGKALGMQLNSGCLRQCPYQTFHDNLHGHGRQRQMSQGRDFGFELFCCKAHFRAGNHEDILKETWIRPEDCRLWEPYVQVMKVSTRRVPHPSLIIKAYAERHFDGSLLKLLDPCLEYEFAGKIIDNSAFPPNWATSGIAAACANDCSHCGKCAELLGLVERQCHSLSH